MALNHVVGLDHVVILVRDLDAAAENWRRLGFTLAPRGIHSAHMGTGNHTVMLGPRFTETEARAARSDKATATKSQTILALQNTGRNGRDDGCGPATPRPGASLVTFGSELALGRPGIGIRTFASDYIQLIPGWSDAERLNLDSR